MGPRAARATHLGLTLLGAVLYVMFVIPRWWVLTGDIPSTAGTVGRIAAGVPIAAAAVPVMLTLQRSLKPEAGTPELALRLRAWAAVLHVVAGILVIATAVAEIWLTLDIAGPWLFAVYGAAGAVAALGVLAFALSFVAEKPPAPPKAPKAPKSPKAKAAKQKTPKAPKAKKPGRIGSRRGRKQDPAPAGHTESETSEDSVAGTDGADTDGDVSPTDSVVAEDIVIEETVLDDTTVDDTTGTDTDTDTDGTETDGTETDGTETAESPTAEPEPSGALLNRRPTGKSRHRLRR